MQLIVPKNLSQITRERLSPFPLKIPASAEAHVDIVLSKQAFAAYDKERRLMRWGPISAGTKVCLGEEKGCLTPTGIYRLQRKEGEACLSKHFPLRLNGQNGGGEMPYCMYFHQDYALHGSASLPGYPASQGCIRLFNEDAQWLNLYFVKVPTKTGKGTLIRVNA